MPDDSIFCVSDVWADCSRDTVVVAPRRVAARAMVSASSADAMFGALNTSNARHPAKICLIPFILLN